MRAAFHAHRQYMLQAVHSGVLALHARSALCWQAYYTSRIC